MQALCLAKYGVLSPKEGTHHDKLDAKARTHIHSMLCEGSSMRAVARVCDVSFKTVAKLLIDAGLACARFHDEAVRDVQATRVQCDEIWSFCYAKKRTSRRRRLRRIGLRTCGPGRRSMPTRRCIVSYLIGGRDSEYAPAFMACPAVSAIASR